MANDDFPSISPPTVVAVKDLKYELFDPYPDVLDDEGNPQPQQMTYEAQIVWSDGAKTIRRDNLVPHLTAQEITGLKALAARLRAKAEAAWGDYS